MVSLLAHLFLIAVASASYKCGVFESTCNEAGKSGIVRKSYIYGDEEGHVEEMYLSDISFSQQNCSSPLFTVTKKLTVNSRSVVDENQTTYETVIQAIEVTIADFEALRQDGIECNVSNETVFPVPIA